MARLSMFSLVVLGALASLTYAQELPAADAHSLVESAHGLPVVTPSRALLDDDETLLKVDRLHLHMEYIGRINFNTRVCRGLDSVQAILEGRVAKLAHCDMDNVRAVALVCFEGGLNVSLKFDTPACRRSAVDAVSLGLSVMQHILADPLESQYSLTLVSATPKLANGMTFPPPLPLDNSSDDDYSYYYGEYTYDPYERK